MIPRPAEILAPRPRGFSIMIVMAAMVIAASAVAAISLVFSGDARRTRAALAGPELRQLLLAGIPAAPDELAARGPAPREVTVPTPLPGAVLKLRIAPPQSGPGSQSGPAADSADVHITAEFKSFRAAQTVRLTRQPNGQPAWTVQQAHLDQMPIQ
jgi:hypothetical protein